MLTLSHSPTPKLTFFFFLTPSSNFEDEAKLEDRKRREENEEIKVFNCLRGWVVPWKFNISLKNPRKRKTKKTTERRSRERKSSINVCQFTNGGAYPSGQTISIIERSLRIIIVVCCRVAYAHPLTKRHGIALLSRRTSKIGILNFHVACASQLAYSHGRIQAGFRDPVSCMTFGSDGTVTVKILASGVVEVEEEVAVFAALDSF
ncbi:hypothetical protein CEXT_346621 [Caerostris extrusa]|uniref:Uncharacterized protein n=1 Tax=Caerostris extrusa TaxID=172846 RepID=A0AAV4P289_CAEEX|nr:hypothetical protein CEXT_346621 [Caerostris extrusa]